MPSVINAYSYRSQLTDFTDAISDRWSDGYDLVNAEYGDGVWFGVFGEDVGVGAYSYESNLSDFAQAVSDRWDQGYELIDVGYGDGVWFGVFNDEDIPGRNGYSYSTGLSDFTQQISDRWDDGFLLSDVEYGDGVWFGVFNEGTGANAYSYDSNLTDFSQAIADRWNQDYELIDVEYGDGVWFGVFGEDQPGLNGYEYRSSLADFEQAIADRWDQGFELIDTSYGNGVWFGVFQQAEDAYEENDSRFTAYDLSNQERTWLSDIDGLGSQFDDDWYEIEVTSGYENVVVDLRFTDAEGDIDVALYDSFGNVVASSTSVTDNEYINTVVDNSGTYFLKVYYDDAGNTYDLWWDDLYHSSALTSSQPISTDDAVSLGTSDLLVASNGLVNESALGDTPLAGYQLYETYLDQSPVLAA